ncbi:uncharacterized protein CCOS01_09859 [Colletotrichum costaricense]|uniref:Uncharacterized protein n=1 Tax=Colletotrichum costaricense TaxID=1209916 RepID=A0AAI9YS89_9PEZI|nr:uncharacterized protein CCOS01_09859 [Colletotrichum costaricense]KAK1522147.1 hypothetical protein CCOS01_09859 [Colletotrichum costaricense]
MQQCPTNGSTILTSLLILGRALHMHPTREGWRGSPAGLSHYSSLHLHLLSRQHSSPLPTQCKPAEPPRRQAYPPDTHCNSSHAGVCWVKPGNGS